MPDAWLIYDQAKEDLDKASPDASGSAGGDGGSKCVDILMSDHLEMVDGE